MIFREMTKKDVEFMKDHSASRGILNKQPKITDFCYTLEHEGKVLGIGGIRLITLTTAWCWVDISDCAKGHIIVGYRTIKEWLNKLVEEKGIKRLQAYIEPDFPEALRMIKHLGFRYESTMKNFLPDGDAYLYSRIT